MFQMNKYILFLAGIAICNYGCYVGAKVHVKTDHLSYPVSYTESFYTHDLKLKARDDYKKIKHISFSFTKWGISAPLNISSDEDISERLNDVIKENEGDALVNVVVSVNSTPVNGVLMVPKSLGFIIGLVGIPLFISEPTGENAALAAGAIVVYLFTPGAATINIEGDIIKIKSNGS